MTIEAGQLRRWNEVSGERGRFLVIRTGGKFLAQGSRAGDKPEDHWEILTAAGLSTGWGTTLLMDLSEPLDAAG